MTHNGGSWPKWRKTNLSTTMRGVPKKFLTSKMHACMHTTIILYYSCQLFNFIYKMATIFFSERRPTFYILDPILLGTMDQLNQLMIFHNLKKLWPFWIYDKIAKESSYRSLYYCTTTLLQYNCCQLQRTVKGTMSWSVILLLGYINNQSFFSALT